MPMDSLQQLFRHELKDMYAGEQEVASALQKLSQCDSNSDLQEIFTTHEEETQEQINRLEQVFQALGESPEAKGGQGIAGIVDEHTSFAQTEPTKPIHTTFDCDAGQKVERYEITAYEGLLKMAQALDIDQGASKALQQNLTEERRQLDRLKNVSHTLNLPELRAE